MRASGLLPTLASPATLLAGLLFDESLYGTVWKWNHKTVFSVLSWLTFAVLLLGRAHLGWRGRHAARLLYIGSGLLLLAYAGLRFTEALGLWHNKRWAKYLGATSGAIYIPFEIDHLLHQPNLGSIAILGVNIYIVVYLVMHLSLEKTA